MDSAAITQRFRCTRPKSRRNRPRVKNKARPKTMDRSCLKRLPGALEAVMDSDSVERKKAMVSISKPTHRLSRKTTA
jgi:hypothetical protein